MSMTQLEQALQLIEDNKAYGYLVGPREERLIQTAEAALGLSFPVTYFRFLRRMGCAGISGAEFYGVVDDDFTKGPIPDGIWLTLKLRKEGAIPPNFIVVSETGDGGYYVIDTSERDAEGENPIVLWFPGLSRIGDKPERIADDFGAFLFQQVSQVVARRRKREGR